MYLKYSDAAEVKGCADAIVSIVSLNLDLFAASASQLASNYRKIYFIK